MMEIEIFVFRLLEHEDTIVVCGQILLWYFFD